MGKLDARQISSDYIGSTAAFHAAGRISGRKNIEIVGKGVIWDEQLQESTARHDHPNKTVQGG